MFKAVPALKPDNAPLIAAHGKGSRYVVLGPLSWPGHTGQSNVGLLVATGGVALEGDPDPIRGRSAEGGR